MPSSAAVKADILENDNAAQHINGRLDPKTPLALEAPFKMIHFLVRHVEGIHHKWIFRILAKYPV